MTEKEKEDMFSYIFDVLNDQKQQSISGITRELKKRGIPEHRLIVTGYLRALRDLDYLEEFDISPSKIYQVKGQNENSGRFEVEDDASKIDKNRKTVYETIKREINSISDRLTKIKVCIYILTKLFSRPCFDYELENCGCDIEILFDKSSSLFKLRADREIQLKYLNELGIPSGSVPYELGKSEISPEMIELANDILISLLKEKIDLTGLVLKKQQKGLYDF